MTAMRSIGMMLLLICAANNARSEEPPVFRYKAGDSYRFKVEQVTKIEDTSIDEETKKPVTSKMQNTLTIVKVWKVREVGANGEGVLELSIASMKLDKTDAKGEVTTFDSEKPDKEDPANDAEFKKFVNQTLAVLTVDARGNVVSVKENKPSTSKGYQIELPFKAILPEKPLASGSSWDRTFEIELPPPAGTGEKFKAAQKFEYAQDVNKMQKIHLTTSFPHFPAGAEGIPLLSYLLEGDVYFHAASGRYIGCRLSGKKVIENYQGEGTRYAFETTLSEDLLK